MTAFIVASSQDLTKIASLDLPLGIARYDDQDDDGELVLGERTLSILELATACVGAIALSASGLERIQRLLQRLDETSGGRAMAICDLSGESPSRQELLLLRFAADRLLATTQRQARRLSELTRSVAALRQSHELTQSAFSKLERFVFENNLAARTLSTELAPSRDMEPIELQPGDSLVQRLSIASTGLCDILIHIVGVDIAEQGELCVILSTVEDGKCHAHWTLTGASLKTGAVRLSLRNSLEAVSLTPVIELIWHGEASCRLAASLMHPDPRFQVRIAGIPDPRVLATSCWCYLPGAEAMLPATGVLPAASASRPPRKRLMDSALLASVIDLTPESQNSRYIPNEETLLVHPMGIGTSVMKIESALPVGTTHVDARICTRADKASEVEYALCVRPRSAQSGQPFLLAQSEASTMSAWIALKVNHPGEIHLPMASPLEEPHDLYFMTRLAVQPGDASWCWASFDRIRITLG